MTIHEQALLLGRPKGEAIELEPGDARALYSADPLMGGVARRPYTVHSTFMEVTDPDTIAVHKQAMIHDKDQYGRPLVGQLVANETIVLKEDEINKGNVANHGPDTIFNKRRYSWTPVESRSIGSSPAPKQKERKGFIERRQEKAADKLTERLLGQLDVTDPSTMTLEVRGLGLFGSFDNSIYQRVNEKLAESGKDIGFNVWSRMHPADSDDTTLYINVVRVDGQEYPENAQLVGERARFATAGIIYSSEKTIDSAAQKKTSVIG